MSINSIISNSRTRFWLLCSIFILSLLLRLSITFSHHARYGLDDWVDAKLYLATGIAFSEGDFFPPDGTRTPYMIIGPAIPMIVAVSRILFGNPILPVLFLNCLVSSLLVFVLYKLGKILVNEKAGVMLALWSAPNYNIIQLNHQILKEPYIIMLVSLITLLLIHVYMDNRILRNTILSSLLFSLLIHIDERFVVYIPVVLFALLASKNVKSRITFTIIWIAVLFISMIPWTIRNYKQFGEIVILTPRTTTITSKLWGTEAIGLHFSDNGSKDELNEFRLARAQEEANNMGVELREYGRLEKYYMAFYHYWKPVYLKTNFIQYGFRPVKWSLIYNLSGIIFYGMFLPFYLLGFIYSWIKRNYPILVLATIPLIHSLIHTAMIWPLDRYRIPMDSLLVIVALWFIFQVHTIVSVRGARALHIVAQDS